MLESRRFFIIKNQFVQQIKKNFQKWKISPLLILAGISFIIAIIFSIYPHGIFQNTRTRKAPSEIKGVSYISSSPLPTNTPTPTVIYKQAIQFTDTPTLAPTTIPSTRSTSSGSSTPTTSPSTPMTGSGAQPTSVPESTVTMQIIEPDGTNSFSVTLHPGNTLCDSLTEAKNEGKIKSVTMTWYANFNSYYINEINGYRNNWTTIVNGAQPQVGCSLIKPKPNDRIVWKFG